jgi:imidazolonepropionase-like amidohydrolase
MLLIHSARLITMAGEQIDNGYIWIDPPVIRAVGDGAVPADILAAHDGPVVDAGGGWLVPGFIDAHCHIGLFNDGLSIEGYDANEQSDPVTPQMQAIDGLFQDDRCFAEALAAGVTTVMTGPGSANVLSGSFALLHTTGRTAGQMLIKSATAIKAALGENPKKTHGKKDRTPMTRMANAAVLREAIQKALHYRLLKDRAMNPDGNKQAEPIAPDARWEALLPLLSGAVPLKIHAHRSDDILTAIRIANEFGLRYTLDHCTEGYLVADLLAEEYIRGRQPGHGCGEPGKGRLEGVITGPIISDRSKPELARASIENPALLAAAGLPMAIMTDHPVIPEQYLPLSAAAAVRGGLTTGQALAAITIDAARICGIDRDRGSLEPGKRADVSLFSNHPFDYRSQTRLVFIDGRLVWHAPDEPLPENLS